MNREELARYVHGERMQQRATPFLVSNATNAIVQLADERDAAIKQRDEALAALGVEGKKIYAARYWPR